MGFAGKLKCLYYFIGYEQFDLHFEGLLKPGSHQARCDHNHDHENEHDDRDHGHNHNNDHDHEIMTMTDF